MQAIGSTSCNFILYHYGQVCKVLLSDKSGMNKPIIMSLASRGTVIVQFIRDLPRTAASVPNFQTPGTSESPIWKNHNQPKVVVAPRSRLLHDIATWNFRW